MTRLTAAELAALRGAWPEVRCPRCRAKLLDGYFLGLLICRKCGEPLVRRRLPAEAMRPPATPTPRAP